MKNYGLVHNEVFFSRSAYRYVLDFATDCFFDKLNVIVSFFRKIGRFAASGNIAIPAGKSFEYGFAIVKFVGERELVDYFAVKLIAYANLDFFKIGKNVKLG